MTITFDQSFQEYKDSVLTTVSDRVEEIKHLIPGWCQSLIVFYDTENLEGQVLACSPDYYYRFIQLIIFPEFLDALDWKISMFHEIQHMILRPYTVKVESIINRFVGDEDVREYLLKDLSNEEEAAVQDLAFFGSKLVVNPVDKEQENVL